MTPTPDDLALAERLLETTGLLRRRTRRAVGAPFRSRLTQAQAEVVRHVRRYPGASVKETAASLSLAPNTVSTLVAGLVESGMLRRETDPADRRVARLELTDTARGPLEAWRERRLAAVGATVAALGAGERTDLEAGLRVMRHLADQLAEGTEDE